MSATKHNAAPVLAPGFEQPLSLGEYGMPLRLVGHVRRAYLSISRCRDLIFSPYGVTTDQYTLLSIVSRVGEIKQSDLNVAMFADANTISSMVTLLQKKGFLTRTPNPSDNRARLIKLTKSGAQMFEYLSREWAPMRRRLAGCLNSKNGRIALSVLEQITAEMTTARASLLESLQSAHATDTVGKKKSVSRNHKLLRT
jgi:DNA-binding MarR family transcriptional regulator